MPRSLVVYFSQDGTTARVAEQVAVGLRGEGHDVDLSNLKDGTPPDPRGYDLLGVGSPVYYFRPPFSVADYVADLPDLAGLPTFVLLLHGTYPGDAGSTIRQALARKGGREVGYFRCHGADYFLGYLKRGYLFSPDHPTSDELARATAFGRQVAGRVAGEPHVGEPPDPPPAPIYRLERLLVGRLLVRQVYSRLFSVDARQCNACGLCAKLCPTGNVAPDGHGRPVWGRNCLLCLTCERRCPRDAITSPVSWPVFLPFLVYNVRHASRDPALSHARVVHRRGRTRPV